MEKKVCKKCGDELRMWKGYCDKNGEPLCNHCVLIILEEPTTIKK